MYGPTGQEYGIHHSHLTLQERFRTRSIRSLQDEIGSIASSQSAFGVRPAGIRLFNGQDLVMMIEKSESLKKLHLNVIEAVMRHRTGYHHQKYDCQEFRDSKFTDRRCYGNLKLYGMPFADPLYNPHVTLAYGLGSEGFNQVMGMASDLNIPSWCANSVVISREDGPVSNSRIHSVLIFQAGHKKS